MNANKRMKYASTPTYGMQKRGFQRGQTAAAPQASGPDFTQLPVPEIPTIPMPQQQQAVGAFMPSGAYPAGSGAFAPTGTLMPPTSFFGGQAMPPTGTTPMQSQPVFGNPSFLQSTPMQSAPLQTGSPMVPHVQPLPLGNAPTVSSARTPAFSPRQQGYVPPAQQLAPPPTQNAGLGGGFPQGAADPLLSVYRPPYTTPTASTPFMPSAMPAGMNQAVPNPYLTPMTGNPVMSGPVNGIKQPMMPAQQAIYPPAPKAPRGPMDLNKGLMYFLFGALPLLFIPCLFVPSAWDFLRYAFLILCVIGIGMMWYRQLFTPNARVTVTILYAALCIVAISMMLSGNRDVRSTGANAASPTQQTESQPTPDPMAAGLSSQEPEETPSPISAPGQSEAEKRFIAFMDFWSADRIDEMLSLVQPSWASAQANPNSELFYLKANRTPIEYTIESISGTDADNSRTVQMSALINKNDGKDDHPRYRFMVIMNKEGGEWYVDPKSLATNDVLTASLDPDSTPMGTATATLRTTVTPVPPPDTKLYYNPNGGNFYHASPDCDTVNSEYLPLQGSFLYRDLKEYQNKNLQPCLKCDAPVNPADE